MDTDYIKTSNPFYRCYLPWVNVLGLIFEKNAVNNNNEFNSRTLREDLLSNNNANRHLYSVLSFSSDTSIASFWMCENEFASMTINSEKPWHITLIRTDNWIRLSLPAKLSKAILSMKQLE